MGGLFSRTRDGSADKPGHDTEAEPKHKTTQIPTSAASREPTKEQLMMADDTKTELEGTPAEAIGGDKGADNDMSAPPLKPFSRKGSHAPTKPPASANTQPEVPRRPPEIPGARRIERTRSLDSSSDHKRLIVGRDICLKGEITSCDKLVVEGQVEVTLPTARLIEVASSGVFKGDADVEEADISGRFEGELTARSRLIVRTGGKIVGKVRYGRIVIEQGGEISGDMQTLEQSSLDEE